MDIFTVSRISSPPRDIIPFQHLKNLNMVLPGYNRNVVHDIVNAVGVLHFSENSFVGKQLCFVLMFLCNLLIRLDYRLELNN